MGWPKELKFLKIKKIYTFYLKDAYWSDGHPVIAQDFEGTWKTNLSPEFPCPFSNDLYVLKNGENAKKREMFP